MSGSLRAMLGVPEGRSRCLGRAAGVSPCSTTQPRQGAPRADGGGGRVTRPAQLLLAGPGRIAGGARSLAEGEHCGRSHWLEGREGGARVSLNGVAEGGARHSPSRGNSGSEAEPPAAERRRDMLAA